jgi:hypothetical protein
MKWIDPIERWLEPGDDGYVWSGPEPSPATEPPFRRIEQQLDQAFLSHPLRKRNPGQQWLALLASLDLMPAVLGQAEALGKADDHQIIRMIRRMEEGIEHAANLLSAETRGLTPFEMTPERLNEAGFFMNHCMNYADIADFHKMHGREQVDTRVDEERRIVRLDIRPESPSSGHGGMEDSFHVQKRRLDSDGPQAMRLNYLLQDEATRYVSRTVKGFIAPPDEGLARSEACIQYGQILFANDMPGLEDEVEVGLFRIGNLRSFWRAIGIDATISKSVSTSNVVRGERQESVIPTISTSLSRYIQRMSRLTGLPADKIEQIVALYEFNPGKSRSFWLQPLLVDRPGDRIAFSAWMICAFSHNRNTLRLLSTQRSTGDAAATVIGSLEPSFIERIAKHVRKRGYQVKTDTIISSSGETGQVDLVAWKASSPNQVLLIEAKAVLAADTVEEVQRVTTEVQKGAKQLQKCVRILESSSTDQKQRWVPFVKWTDRMSFHKIVLTPRSGPNHKYDHSDAPAVLFEIMTSQLRSRDWKSPSELIEVLRQREEHRVHHDYIEAYREVAVGSIRYHLPVLLRRAKPD